MKKPGEFILEKERHKKRQQLFDLIKKYRTENFEGFINVDKTRVKIKSVKSLCDEYEKKYECKGFVIQRDSDYVVFIHNELHIAHNAASSNYWWIDRGLIYRMSEPKLKEHLIGIILKI